MMRIKKCPWCGTESATRESYSELDRELGNNRYVFISHKPECLLFDLLDTIDECDLHAWNTRHADTLLAKYIQQSTLLDPESKARVRSVMEQFMEGMGDDDIR